MIRFYSNELYNLPILAILWFHTDKDDVPHKIMGTHHELKIIEWWWESPNVQDGYRWIKLMFYAKEEGFDGTFGTTLLSIKLSIWVGLGLH